MDHDKLYYAQLNATSPRINPLLLKADSVSPERNHFGDDIISMKSDKSEKVTFSALIHSNKSSDNGSNTEVELQKLGPSDDEMDGMIGIDELDDPETPKHKKHKLSTWSDIGFSSMTRIENHDLRDRALCAMILRESRTALSISKMEFESIGKWRQILYAAVHSIVFETVITVMIVLNIICLSLKKSSNSQSISTVSRIEDVFLFLFFGELILRIVAVGFISFWTKSSLFVVADAVLILVCFVSFWLYIAGGSDNEYLNGLGGTVLRMRMPSCCLASC